MIPDWWLVDTCESFNESFVGVFFLLLPATSGILKEKCQLWHFKEGRQKRWHFKGWP